MAAQAFKEFEHQAWQQAVDHYEASFARLTQQMFPTLLDVLSVQNGTRFLDVACGPGHLSAAARDKGALASGVDFSSSMILKAKKLHPGMDFHIGDAEDLKEFQDLSFDAVAMNFGILHLDQPENALNSIHRVLKPGGKVAFTVWCKPQEAIGFSIVLQAIEAVGNPRVNLPPAPPFFFYSEPENCKAALTRCGFAYSNTQFIQQKWELDTPDELFEAFFKGTARTAGLLKGQSPEQLMSVRKAIHQTASQYMHKGKIVLPMPAIVAWGTKL